MTEDRSIKEIVRDLTDGRSLVYFVECAGHIKIGYTRSFVARWTKMLTDLPPEPHLLHLEDGTRKTEQILHREFAELRIRGEWFRVDQRIYEHIQRRRIVLELPEFEPPSQRKPEG